MKSTLANKPLAELLDQHTQRAAPALCSAEGERVRCLACGHRCLIGPGQRGICKVRFVDDGRLMAPFGYVAGVQSDPVEKKPFFHVYPGSDALTFGMMGCDLHCSYCQNWLTSQALRDSNAVAPIRQVSAADLVAIGKREGARLVVSSYNEPLITAEWAVAVFKEARAAGLACAFVSNGNATPEVLDFLRPWIVAYKVDLKSFNDRNYRQLGGVLENITNTIRMIHERGIWLEIVTLVVPGFNDSRAELRDIARFLVSISPNIPWHVTAFHKDYRLTDPDPTSALALRQAAEIGAEEGLHFVYAGNLPGQVSQWENTRCPSCQANVIERSGYLIRAYRLTPDGHCPQCRFALPGIWSKSPPSTNQSGFRMPRPLAMAAAPQFPVAASGPGSPPAPNAVNRPSPALQDRRQGLPFSDKNRAWDHNSRTIPKKQSSPPSKDGPLSTMNQGEQTAMAATQSTTRPASSASRTADAMRPQLAAEQQEQLLAGVATLLKNLVLGGPAVFPAGAAEIGNLPVWGAFVSLKRGRHLRSCSGAMGFSMPLQQAVCSAAERTIWEDERFPPVSPSELAHLQMELWLLFDPQPVLARGEARAQAITLGKHGIQVARDQARGLFLPGVATDNEWDVHTFLDRVCMKAGLPATAWKDDDTALMTFEGEVLHGSLAQFKEVELRPPQSFCRTEDLANLAGLCKANLVNLLLGAAPCMFGSAPDGMVSGVVLSFRIPDNPESPSFARFAMRPGLALHSTLFGLIQAGAQHLASQGQALQSLDGLSVGLTILHDPVMHGTVADPHLDGFDPRKRAFLVVERNKAGLLFDEAKEAGIILEEASGQARVTQPAMAGVFSLACVSNVPRITVSTAPRPVRGPAVRPAAVAGQFYDADPGKLSRMVDGFLTGDGAETKESRAAALIPHAGLQFSGRIVGRVLRRIKIPQTVIVIGPNHTGQGMEWAVAPQQTWAMPGFEVASDFMLVRKLCQAITGLEMDAAAHQNEHAIEVELPFLARLAPETRVIGITIAHGDLESCRRFSNGLAEVIRGLTEPPLLLISSDMNHFATDGENRRLDALAMDAMESGDPEELFNTVNRHHISMCGMLPAVIVMETLKLLGRSSKAAKVAYATTADVTGDKSRVVGYAGMLLG